MVHWRAATTWAGGKGDRVAVNSSSAIDETLSISSLELYDAVAEEREGLGEGLPPISSCIVCWWWANACVRLGMRQVCCF